MYSRSEEFGLGGAAPGGLFLYFRFVFSLR
jgi:hypothetical protein